MRKGCFRASRYDPLTALPCLLIRGGSSRGAYFRRDDLPGDDERIREYMTHGFKTDGEHWGVFSVHALAEAPKFLKAAV